MLRIMQESNNKHSEKCPKLIPFTEEEDKKRQIVNLILIFSWPISEFLLVLLWFPWKGSHMKKNTRGFPKGRLSLKRWWLCWFHKFAITLLRKVCTDCKCRKKPLNQAINVSTLYCLTTFSSKNSSEPSPWIYKSSS